MAEGRKGNSSLLFSLSCLLRPPSLPTGLQTPSRLGTARHGNLSSLSRPRIRIPNSFLSAAKPTRTCPTPRTARLSVEVRRATVRVGLSLSLRPSLAKWYCCCCCCELLQPQASPRCQSVCWARALFSQFSWFQLTQCEREARRHLE